MDLRLLQLGDSALPIGGYSHSWGLEAAIEKGQVWDAFSCEQWMRSWLCHGIGPCEGIVVAPAAATETSPAEALAVYLHQAALGGIGAGVRAIPIGHSHGQQILARLHEDLKSLASDLAERDLETAGAFAPAYEVLCYAQSH